MVDDLGEAWVLIDEPCGRGLGGALAWAVRRECSAVHIVAEAAAVAGAGAMARRAGQLTMPVTVQHLDGRSRIDVIADPLPVPVRTPEPHRAFIAAIVAGGAVAVQENGVVSGEVAGLEVCRVVDDPVSGSPRLAVGIGAHDRELYQMLHGDRSPTESLADVVRSVAAHRVPGAERHPLNLIAASRLLRSRLIADPRLVGLDTLVAGEPPVARTNLKDEVPCVAVDPTTATVVVCVSGVDLDAVPYAGDVISQHAAARCIIAAPDRDVLPIQQRLAELVTVPTRFAPIPSPAGAS